MPSTNPSRGWALACCVVASLAFGLPTELRAKEPVPQVSPEGLQLQANTRSRLSYVRPGASFEQYSRVVILEPLVEFEKKWQRDYNATHAGGLSSRITDQDMVRMKAVVAEGFKKAFARELSDGGYQVVEAAGPDVLILKPAIIDLEVTAPDLMKGGRSRTWVESAGRMTLYLELWDSTSNTILARIMDAKADDQMGGMAALATRGSNRAAMDDMLEDWAEELREHLDAARGKAAASR